MGCGMNPVRDGLGQLEKRLHLIQDLRRQKLGLEHPLRTNDLTAVLRFYNLRRNSATNSALASALDQVFTNFVSGQEENALNQLGKLETQFP